MHHLVLVLVTVILWLTGMIYSVIVRESQLRDRELMSDNSFVVRCTRSMLIIIRAGNTLLLIAFFVIYALANEELTGLLYLIPVLLLMLMPILIMASRFRIVVNENVIEYTPKIGKRIVFEYSDISKAVYKNIYSRMTSVRDSLYVYVGDKKPICLTDDLHGYNMFENSLLKRNIEIIDKRQQLI